MRRSSSVLPPLACLLLGAFLFSACTPPPGEVSVDSDDDKTLYALGLMVGQQTQGFDLTEAEARIVAKGVMDAATGEEPEVELREWAPKVMARRQEAMTKQAGEEKAKSKAFIEKMAAEEGAETTESGLVFIPIKEGTGESPEKTDKVSVHYHGTLADGTVFDSSVDRGKPAEFPLNRVIPCWTEGVQKLKVGGKAKLICPSSIAYGDRGQPPKIPGGAALAFEVELLEIK